MCRDQSSAQLARKLNISRTTAPEVRHQLQANAEHAQPQSSLDDLEVETDEMFQNSGEKVTGILIRNTHPAFGLINDRDEGLMPIIVRRSCGDWTDVATNPYSGDEKYQRGHTVSFC
jgi:hypothetical protein